MGTAEFSCGGLLLLLGVFSAGERPQKKRKRFFFFFGKGCFSKLVCTSAKAWLDLGNRSQDRFMILKYIYIYIYIYIHIYIAVKKSLYFGCTKNFLIHQDGSHNHRASIVKLLFKMV